MAVWYNGLLNKSIGLYALTLLIGFFDELAGVAIGRAKFCAYNGEFGFSMVWDGFLVCSALSSSTELFNGFVVDVPDFIGDDGGGAAAANSRVCAIIGSDRLSWFLIG